LASAATDLPALLAWLAGAGQRLLGGFLLVMNLASVASWHDCLSLFIV